MKRWKKVADILIRRDGLTSEEANEMIHHARSEIIDAIEGTSGLDPEEVLACELGLEPDYLFDII